MSDLLVKLYDLPSSIPVLEGLADSGIVVRRALASEKAIVGTLGVRAIHQCVVVRMRNRLQPPAHRLHHRSA